MLEKSAACITNVMCQHEDSMSLRVKCNLSVSVSMRSESVGLSLVVGTTGLIKSKLAFRPTNGTGAVW